MWIEEFLKGHSVWLDFFTAVGTVGATVVALWVALRRTRDERDRKLSGVSLVDPSGVGTVYLVNSTDADIRNISVEKNEALIEDSEAAVRSHEEYLRPDYLRSVPGWQPVIDTIDLSPGQRLPIHLKDLVAEETFIALVGLCVEYNGLQRYTIYRYAGERARHNEELRGLVHPHKEWVLVYQR